MYEVYIVKEGDNLSKIANKFNVSVEELYNLNAFGPLENVVVGQRIIVPVPKPQLFDYYTIKKGDSLYNVAKQFNTTPEKLSLINGLNINDYVYQDQVILIPKSGVNIYISKLGDSLESIAKKLDSSIAEVVLQNKNLYIAPDQLIVTVKTDNQAK